jgi:hypothetical protein
VKALCRNERQPGTPPQAGSDGSIRRLLISVGGEKGKGSIDWSARYDVDDTAERVAAIQIGNAALNNLHRVYGSLRYTIPIDPAAKGIAKRYSIGNNERPAGSACSHTAQRDSQRGWIRRQAAVAAKGHEPGNLAQRVVESNPSAGAEILLAQDRHARSRVADALRGAGSGNRDPFGDRGGSQSDLDRLQALCGNVPGLLNR